MSNLEGKTKIREWHEIIDVDLPEIRPITEETRRKTIEYYNPQIKSNLEYEFERIEILSKPWHLESQLKTKLRIKYNKLIYLLLKIDYNSSLFWKVP